MAPAAVTVSIIVVIEVDFVAELEGVVTAAAEGAPPANGGEPRSSCATVSTAVFSCRHLTPVLLVRYSAC
jgi:hypothetical protein